MVDTATESACDEPQTEIAIIVLGREYGSADSQTLVDLELRLKRAMEGHPVGLVIDLGKTIYIGCGFLNVMLRCFGRARESSRCFALCSHKSLPENVFKITCLDSLWGIFQTHQEAVETMLPPEDNALKIPIQIV